MAKRIREHHVDEALKLARAISPNIDSQQERRVYR